MDSDSDDDLKRAIALSLEGNTHDISSVRLSNPPVPLSDDEADELKIAIALSLGGDTQIPKKAQTNEPLVIDLLSEDDDDDLDAPVAARKLIQENHRKHDDIPASALTNSSTSPALGKIHPNVVRCEPEPGVVGLSGMNRKQMEEERLARVSQKRKRDNHAESETKDARNNKSVKLNPPTQPHLGDCRPDQPAQSLIASPLQYPGGVVKRTWVFGSPRSPDDIKIEEVVQRSGLELAVLSAFQIDPDWIISKLDPKTKVIWVLQAKTEAEQRNWRSQAPPNYKFCFPSMDGNINCMHSKLQLLAYSTHLRVVIPSANLTSYDWGETGVMENTCFLIDLPRRSETSHRAELTEFGRELIYFVEAMGMEKSVVESINNFDFSRTAHLAFVHSIGGNHTDRAADRTGFGGLARSVRALGLATSSQLEIDYITSSIGSLKQSFLESMYSSAQGHELQELELLPRKQDLTSSSAMGAKPKVDLLHHFRIYFPTRKTVAESKGGFQAAGTICCSSKAYDADTFPRSLMRDCKSRRSGLLMHNKIMFVRSESSTWAYVGSANLSESAWGRIVNDKRRKVSRLNLRNWECGVLVPVKTENEPGNQQCPESQGILGLEIFKNQVPIPMLLHGRDGVDSLEYGDKRPWFFA